jgi:flagellar hook-basal body complex protein FliE
MTTIGPIQDLQPLLPGRRIDGPDSADLRPQLTPLDEGADSNGTSFSNLLGDAMNRLVSEMKSSDRAVMDLASGRRDDIANVMIEVHKAGLAFQIGLEVRNRLMDAYHEITRTSV